MKKKFLFLLAFLFFSRIYSQGIDLVAPINNFSSPSFTVNFSWNPVSSQTGYKLKIASDSNFNNIINNISLTQTLKQITFSNSVSSLYWKIVTDQTNGYMESETYKLNFSNPLQNTDLLLWLSADSNVVLNPDSTISAWNNIIPNGLNAVQANTARQAKLISKRQILNNKNVIRFDGIDDNFTINSGGQVGSLFILFNFNAPSFTTYNALLTHQSIATFDDYYITATFPGTTRLESANYFGSNKGSMFLNKSPIPTSYSIAPLSTYKIVAGTRNIQTILTAPNFNIGAEGAGIRFWSGDVSEIIISKSKSLTAADSIQTYLLNKYAPPVAIRDTVIGNSFCSNVTISAPNNYTNYLWSNGATTPTIVVTPNNKYYVKTKDVFDYESITYFNIFPYVRLGNKNVYICPRDTFRIDLKIPAGFTVLWSNGASTPKLNIYQTGQYTVTITDASGTCSVRDTINLIVDNSQLSPTPDINDSLRLCLNEKLFLNTVTAFDSIRWSTGSTSSFITVLAPGNYSVYGRTYTGCVINKSFKVKINGEAPVADFGYSSVCQNAATQFIDSTTSSVGSTITNWKWTFGNGNISSVQDPVNIYASLGTYSVGFKVTTNQGCSDSIAKTILVNKKPIPQFYNLLSCAGNPTTFVDQTLANAASITNWSWDFNGLGTANGIQNPAFRFPSAGTYNVQLTATNSNGCSEDTIISTTVEVAPIADFSYDSVCGKTPLSFKFLATIPSPNTIPSWIWDFGDGTIESAIKSPQHVYESPGTYDVMLFVNSSNQCVDTVIKQIKVFDFPIVDFDISQTQCVGKEIQFTDISTTPDGTPVSNWNWFFSGQATSTEQNPRYTFNTEGNYTIQLTAKNAVNCNGTKLRSIAVSTPPTPKFTFSPQNGLPPLCVTYNNQSPVGGNYLWSYGDGGSLIEAYNPPQHCYNTIGTYPIKLIATDFRGCTDTLTKLILVDKAFLDGVMANVSITPNGEYYQVQVTIINNSNVEITTLGLGLQLGSGSIIRENWTGSLLPGKTFVYTFNGEIKISENAIPVVCALIDNVNNNSFEDRTDNNSTCKEVKVGSFDVLSIYPNPAYEIINFGIMLPKDGRVNIQFIDILGQRMYNKEFDGIKGYNNFQMTTMPLNAAVYVAETLFDGQIIRKKFMRKDRK